MEGGGQSWSSCIATEWFETFSWNTSLSATFLTNPTQQCAIEKTSSRLVTQNFHAFDGSSVFISALQEPHLDPNMKR